ncbi:hypothetical protein R3P38DRAFT_3184071 [Favolaschia claudopus]|uniref:CCHC-type domain-containing protein n=1 Tax=Favolaschia claudopus TaxID=2862362 RepID=A0AAW0CBP9_9AGAR
MQSTTSIPVVQRTAEASTTVVDRNSTEVKAVPQNANGPQCAHCGWRGGEHASNCPFK